ncbi:hypothetical protein CTheo_7148 [Ceratobasidium theobromae]|uniref:Nephrocystin 3-like N-terminal domain-containing protein n=1 Tax=Ceratobasidium theobromae TaxID=1582974 RepID=A0A5N5QD82_9AGAM|nr:hypothetical protein CTheo_7148 [Ceratobasidium theobromae]
MSPPRVFKITGEAALRLLRLTYTSTDVFPLLKEAAGGVLQIVETASKFKASKKKWNNFNIYIRDAVATIIDSHRDVDPSQTEISEKLLKLQSALQDILRVIESEQRKGRFERFRRSMEYPEMIEEMTERFQETVDLFVFGAVVRTEINVGKTLKLAEKNAEQLSLSKLQYVQGASWNPRRVCLSDTRKNLIKEIVSWIDNPGDSNTMLLTGVAGSGKSTIAHTIAQQCSNNHQLVTSFFFDRETSDRNHPGHLITTMAADLGRIDARLADSISSAIKADRGLSYAPISRQFDELVMTASQGISIEHPLVIVLDALDEGCNEELLQILCNDASRLPPYFRLLLTSRMYPELGDLRLKPHVRSMELDIHAQDNIRDISVFVPHRLKQVAERHELEENWPGEQLASLFEARAGGLFLWVATICDFLCTRSNPTTELQKLLSASPMSNTSAEVKMDQLYITILHACDWTDEAFADEYQQLMGAVVATKIPLTISGLAELFNRAPLVGNLILRQLSPLLTGLNKAEHTSHPVRFLHQSLRDFLTLRANNLEQSRPFAINEKAHSQTLARLCLECLNKELKSSLPGVGYLAKSSLDISGIPPAPQEGLQESVWYACRFWIDHLLYVNPNSPGDVSQELNSCERLAHRLNYMDRREEALTACQDAVAIHRHICTINQVEFSPALASSLSDLSDYLRALALYDEAQSAAEEAVKIYRRLSESDPNKFAAEVARALAGLSAVLTDLGRYEEAMTITQEVISTRRKLAADHPDKFTYELAQSLHDFSVDLLDLGRYEESLSTIREAVKIRRQLAVEDPGSFADLADSIHSCSLCLSSLKRDEEALVAGQESLAMYRRLATDRPAIFAPELASALQDVSSGLSNLGRDQEALGISQEVVETFRRLAAARPAVFNSELAGSLYDLSVDLSNLGRHKEALEATEESIKIRRQLAADRPAAFASSLAESLQGLSRDLTELDRPKEAMQAAQEAMQMFRKLAADRPAVYTADLAESIHDFSNSLSEMGLLEEAVTAMLEALEIRRRLAAERPAVFNSELAESLHDFSVDLCDLGRYEEALPAVQEAVEISRQLRADNPTSTQLICGLATSLRQLSLNLCEMGRHEEALPPARESVELCRPLASENPREYAGELSESLERLADALSATGAEQEALAARKESEALTWEDNSDSDDSGDSGDSGDPDDVDLDDSEG